MATECWDCGDKAGFITLWPNNITRDKDFKRVSQDDLPGLDTYAYEVEFDLGDDAHEKRCAYLSMMAKNVAPDHHNRLYLNHRPLGELYSGHDWGFDTFCIDAGIVHPGVNTFKLTVTKNPGDLNEKNNVQVRNPLLIYAVK